VCCALALLFLPQPLAGLFAPRTEADASATTWLVLAIAVLIGFAAQIALNRLAIGPATTVGAAISRGFARMPMLLAAFLILICALTGLLILIPIVLGAAG